MTVARGSPYLASLLCHHASHAAIDASRATVLPADVAQAVALAVQEFEGRVPKPIRAHVKRLFAREGAEALALAARVALAGDGSFSAADLALVNETTVRKSAELVSVLKTEELVRPTVDDDERYVFIEDGLPTLIWMMWAQLRMQPEPRSAQAAAS